MTHDVIAKSVAEATIHAPVAAIDLTEWVFTLTDTEYQACSKDHIAGAVTATHVGKRMSVNVERRKPDGASLHRGRRRAEPLSPGVTVRVDRSGHW